jgi:transcriptional regulator NrdR family protein
MYKVLKKDGRIEDFDWRKLTDGIRRSGATKDEAEQVAAEIELWLSKVDEDGTVKSNDLHIQVLESLRKVNPKAAAAFEAFKKPEI